LRWNVHEQTDIPTVADVLGVDEGVRELLQQFGILYIMNEPVVALSSGELRKLQIVKALSCGPRLLILDNPFIGLDADARTMLTALLSSLAVSGGVQIMLLLSSLADVPQFVDSVIPVEDMRVGKKVARESFVLRESQNKNVDNAHLQQMLLTLPVVQKDTVDEVLSFNNVSVKYGTRTILRNISWKVRSGEVWLLGGANGSGKYTLLSLVCADNLQSYACDITLFGRKRGTGESIWDIKKRIGYVSPEMHRSYLRNIPVKDIVASGLFDTIGLYRRPSEEQVKACSVWMELFGISHIAEKSFLRVSSGEQRLALLARAFVKDPSLLILDEPMHGLDSGRRAMVKGIIEAFSKRKGKTIIFVSHYEEDAPSTVSHRLELVKPIGNM
jgi:molybdate transport system ATP-binding protein